MCKVTKEQREIIERELRRGTSKSRISALLNVNYEEGVQLIESVKVLIRPDVGDRITFLFRDAQLVGVIVKLLTNSAVVEIDWHESDTTMQGVCSSRTIVNFKDIQSFIVFEE